MMNIKKTIDITPRELMPADKLTGDAAGATSRAVAASLTTAILVPLLTSIWGKRVEGVPFVPLPVEKLQAAE